MIDKDKRREEIKRDCLFIYKELMRSKEESYVGDKLDIAFNKAIQLDKKANQYLDDKVYSVVYAEDEVLLSIDGENHIYYFTTFNQVPCKVTFLDSNVDDIKNTYLYDSSQILNVFTTLGASLIGKKVGDAFIYEDEESGISVKHRVIVLGVRKSILSTNLSKEYIEAEIKHRKRK